MKKITFEVSTKKEVSVVSLIKAVNKISCRIQIDLENGFVTAEDVEDNTIDSIIELIDQYYTVSSVNIENTSDESTLAENSHKDKLEVEAEKTAKHENKPPTMVAPQSEKNLIIQKVKFRDKYIEGLINKFVRTAYWAMYRMHIPSSEIGDSILTSMSEISMRYNNKGCIEYSVGDIVDCNYGVHLGGEINGGHIFAIVCKVTTGSMAYLVPIIKASENVASLSYLTFDVPEDVIYDSEYYTNGTVLLDKGRFLRAERFHAVVGKTTPEFFTKVLKQLSTTFDFTGNTVMNDDDTEIDSGNDGVKVAEAETAMEEERLETTAKVNHTESISEGVDNSEVTIYGTKPKRAKKVGGEEVILLNAIGDSLKKLDCTKTVEEQVETFLTDIGMVTTDRMVTQSFVIACNIKKIKYENVILELHNMFPKVKEELIKLNLKENFSKWLDVHPEIVESYPKISFIALLKVFAKKFA